MRAKIGTLWLLTGVAVALMVLGGCPKTQSTDTAVPSAKAPPPPTDAAAGEASAAAGPVADAPDNIGNGNNKDGEYVCPVMGTVLTKLDDELSVEHEGKVYYFCCAGCPEKFEADPAKYISQIEAGGTAAGEGTEGTDSDDGHQPG